MKYRYKRRVKKYKKVIFMVLFIILLCFSIGYSAFSTNINIGVIGKIENIDDKVSTSELLFWGDAGNNDNSSTILKDKSGRDNDGKINGSLFENGDLVFDGIDDFVNLGYKGYDFKNTISYVMYVRFDKLYYSYLFGNWEGAGGGIYIDSSNSLVMDAYDKSLGKYVDVSANLNLNIYSYYTIIGVLDGNVLKLYIDGELIGTSTISTLELSYASVYIGANNNTAALDDGFAAISLKEAMLYDRAISADEVITFTKMFEHKYKNISN